MRTLAIWLALHVPAPASCRPWLLGAAIGRRPRKVEKDDAVVINAVAKENIGAGHAVVIDPDGGARERDMYRRVSAALLLFCLAAPLAAQMQPDPFHLTASPEGGVGAPGEGTVTSVALAAPADLFSVSGSPVTDDGTLTLTKATVAANTCYAGPASGGAAAPTFRLLVAADIPGTIASNTTGNAATATQLAADPANCAGGTLPRGIADTGAAQGCAAVNLATESTGAAPTATALAADGTNCSGVQASQGVDASGNAQGCFTPTGGAPAGAGSELQFRVDGTTFGAVTSSSVSGANVTLGGTLGGVTQLNVDNLRADGNTISSTDTNGPITLDPSGTGPVVVSAADLVLDAGRRLFLLGVGDNSWKIIATNENGLGGLEPTIRAHATGFAQQIIFGPTPGQGLAFGQKAQAAAFEIETTGNGTYLTHINTPLFAQRSVEANTAGSGAPNALLATEWRKLLTNEGATAENHQNLPAAAAGIEYTFCVQDADGLQINAAAGDTIRIGTSVSASAGNIESTSIGACVTIVAINATEWFATDVITTWTVN